MNKEYVNTQKRAVNATYALMQDGLLEQHTYEDIYTINTDLCAEEEINYTIIRDILLIVCGGYEVNLDKLAYITIDIDSKREYNYINQKA